MNALLLFGALLLSFQPLKAQVIPILDGADPSKTWSAAQVAAQIHPGQIVVMGENHGLPASTQSQMQLLNALRGAGRSVSVGFEFFYYPDQPLVRAFRANALSEAEFLKQIQWGQVSFDFYRPQALFPRLELHEETLALNAPRTLTGKIAKQGLESLTEVERQLLPPNFELGRASYKKRFLAQMPHLPSPADGDRYFAAMSAWDDTMAWQAAEFIKVHPDQVLVIVVGDFHAQYSGGLPARIQARTQQKPWVFSLVNPDGLTKEEVLAEIQPSPVDGPRGDFIWLAPRGPSFGQH